MLRSVVFGFLLLNSASSDDQVLREQFSGAQNLPTNSLRYIFSNKLQVPENLKRNESTPHCPNTEILLKILDILTKAVSPNGHAQLDPYTIKYVLEVIKQYLEHSTPSTEHTELYNRFYNLENSLNLVKPTSRNIPRPNTNNLRNEGLKAKVTVQIELPVVDSEGQNIYEHIVKFVKTAFPQYTKYCNASDLYVPKSDSNTSHDNYLNSQKHLESVLSKLLAYLQHSPVEQEEISQNNAYDDSLFNNNVNFFGNNDIMSLLQNYRPQEPASDNNNVPGNQVTMSLLEQLLSNQSQNQIYVPPNGIQNEANQPPGHVNNADNSQIKLLIDKIISTASGSHANSDNGNGQNSLITKLLLEKLLQYQIPGQLPVNNPNQSNQGSNMPQISNNNVVNNLQDNQAVILLLKKLLLNESSNGALDNSNKQQNQATNPTEYNSILENFLKLYDQDYQVPNSYVLGPPQLNVTYTISNGRVIPVSEIPKNVDENSATNNVNTLNADVKKQQEIPNNPTSNLHPNTAGNQPNQQTPNLNNNQNPFGQWFDVNSFNTRGNINPVNFPINSPQNSQTAQYSAIGYLPSAYYLNSNHDINNPNQQNVFNQYQNSHSKIIGLNQNLQPGYVAPNLLPRVNIPYIHPNTINPKPLNNNEQGNNGFNLLDSNRFQSLTNPNKLESALDNSNKLIEITYVLQRPQQVLYEPVYYVKYRIPYNKFKYTLQNLILTKPYLQNNPNLLYQELLAQTNLPDSSPDLQSSGKVMKLAGKNGTLIDAKLLHANETAIGEQLKIVQELNSKLDPKDVVNLNIAAVNQLKNLRSSNHNNMDVTQHVTNSTAVKSTSSGTIANHTLNQPIDNTRSMSQVKVSTFTSQSINKNQVPLSTYGNLMVYSGQTMQYQLPLKPNVPLVYSQNPLMQKQNFVFGK